MIVLRDYQSDMVQRIGLALSRARWVVGQAPTGAGKTIIFSFICAGALRKGNTVMIVAHRSRLCDQISAALTAFGVPHGRIQTGHVYDPSQAVQVGMVRTVHNRLPQLAVPTLLVIDECHHVMSTTYLSLVARWMPKYLLGVTATPLRLDKKGLGDVFKAIEVGPQPRALIAAGWLSAVTHIAPPPLVDLAGIPTVRGDYAQGALGEAMDKPVITGDAVARYRHHLHGKPAIAFCVTLDHARSVAAEFTAAGYRSAVISGGQREAEQEALLDRLGQGGLDVLVSCEMVGEGLDVPVVAGVILLRPTKSATVYLQQIGRALRPKPKPAIVLDLVANWKTHGLADDSREWKLTGTELRSQTSQCQICYRVFSTAEAGWRETAECGDDQPRPRGCLLSQAPSAGTPRLPPPKIAGKLVHITRYPPWARGLNILEARGPDWRRLLILADTAEKLTEIAVARKYRRGWVRKTMHERIGHHHG